MRCFMDLRAETEFLLNKYNLKLIKIKLENI